jgi:hypothetical protein
MMAVTADQFPPHPVRMVPPPERFPRRLTFADIELWCQEMRARDARPDAPVRGTLTMGGFLVELAAFPTVE